MQTLPQPRAPPPALLPAPSSRHYTIPTVCSRLDTTIAQAQDGRGAALLAALSLGTGVVIGVSTMEDLGDEEVEKKGLPVLL